MDIRTPNWSGIVCVDFYSYRDKLLFVISDYAAVEQCLHEASFHQVADRKTCLLILILQSNTDGQAAGGTSSCLLSQKLKTRVRLTAKILPLVCIRIPALESSSKQVFCCMSVFLWQIKLTWLFIQTSLSFSSEHKLLYNLIKLKCLSFLIM